MKRSELVKLEVNRYAHQRDCGLKSIDLPRLKTVVIKRQRRRDVSMMIIMATMISLGTVSERCVQAKPRVHPLAQSSKDKDYEHRLDQGAKKLNHSAQRLRKYLHHLQILHSQDRQRASHHSKNNSSKTEQKTADVLDLIERSSREVHEQVMIYYQAPRSMRTSRSPATIKLRDEVWSLLHADRGMYQRSDGRFCLRASWRLLIASTYHKLGEMTKSSLHQRHAQACPPRPHTIHKVDCDE